MTSLTTTGAPDKGETVKCAYRPCKERFETRDGKRFCSERCQKAWAYDLRRAELGAVEPRKRRLATTLPHARENGHFSSTKTGICKEGVGVEIGEFIRRQIEAQKDSPNPIHYRLPCGRVCKVWLAHEFWLGGSPHAIERNKTAAPKIGDARHSRLNAVPPACAACARGAQ
jgi:hypothetical protein